MQTQVFVLVLLALGCVQAQLNETQSLTTRESFRYDKWHNPARVLYRWDERSYSADEKALIKSAMSQISLDMDHCINFQELNALGDAESDNLYISKTLKNGALEATCVTYYGRLLGAGPQNDQELVIHNLPNGCMGSKREVMAFLFNVLGMKNEFNRPDRDDFIKVFKGNLRPELLNSGLVCKYNASVSCKMEAKMGFDYNSITIPRADRYAMENSTIMEYPSGKTIPALDRLSQDDCIILSRAYGCDKSKCVDPYAGKH